MAPKKAQRKVSSPSHDATPIQTVNSDKKVTAVKSTTTTTSKPARSKVMTELKKLSWGIKENKESKKQKPFAKKFRCGCCRRKQIALCVTSSVRQR
jgi:hypothetical protein